MQTSLTFTIETFETPTGGMFLVTDDQQRARALDWQDHEDRMSRLMRLHYGNDVRLVAASNPTPLRKAVQSYFGGNLDSLADLVTETNGSAFQREVWASLRRIPVGKTISYGELAKRVGRPQAARAIGLANGSNPIAIIVPCHRVIGANGQLTGFGGGLDRKRWLIEHERANAKTGNRSKAHARLT